MSCEHDCRKPDRFPAPVHNRPGLGTLRYRIGAYPSIRGYLLDALDKDPVLRAFTHRGADDPGIALLEGAAVVGDILTFYQELYANEAFLRTAKWTESVADLVRLTGYRLAPGLGGLATFALLAKAEPERLPGSEPVPVTVPKGFRLKAHVEGREKPDDFETSGETSAYPHLSRFRLYRPPLPPARIGTGGKRDVLEVMAAGGSSSPEALAKAALKAGDRIMLVPGGDMWDRTGAAYKAQEPAEILEVDAVEILLDRTLLTFKTPLAFSRASTTIRAYRVDRNFTHFGAAAPPTTVMVNATTQETEQYATDFVRDIFGTHSPAAPADRYPAIPAREQVLDGKVDGLKAGGRLICTGYATFTGQTLSQRFTVVKTIEEVRPDTLPWGSLSGPATVVVTDAKLIANDSILNERADIRHMLFHEATSEELTLAAPRSYAGGAFPDGRILFFGYASETRALAGRALLLEHEDGRRQQVTVTEVGSPLDTGWTLSGGSLSLFTAGSLLSTTATMATSPALAAAVALAGSPSAASATSSSSAALASGATGSGLATASLGTAASTASGAVLAPAAAASLNAAVSGSLSALVPALSADLFLAPSLLSAYQGGDRPRLWTLTLDARPDFHRQDFDERENRVWVYGNLVEANQGKTEAEAVLGDGDGRALFQTFPLPKSPLTFLLEPESSPPETPELSIYVDGLLWTRVDTLFASGPKDLVYVVRQDGEGRSHIQFGDGKTGARLPSGKGNVTAVFRSGSGARGPAKAGTTPSAGERLAGLDKVLLPLPVVGGADPEGPDTARIAAPGKLQSLGRLVSLADYEAECLALPSVVKCRADWALEDGIPLLRLVVLTDSGDAADLAAVEAAMLAAARCRGPVRFPLRVAEGRRRHLHVALTLGMDPARREDDLRRDVQAALGAAGAEGDGVDGSGGLFGESRRFGQTAHASQVLAAAQNVPGILWAKAQACRVIPLPNPPVGDPLDLPAPPVPAVHDNLNCSGDELLALHTAHLALAFTVAAKGGCG